MIKKEINKYQIKKGFSLIELLIVISIISLVYYLGLSGVELGKQKPKALTPLNLKENIIKSNLFSAHATFMCLDKCKICYIRKDISTNFEIYPHDIELTEIKAYVLDERDSLKRIQYERFDDKKICLIMNFYDNGSSTQIILKNKKGVYFLPAFFGEAVKVDSIEDAKEYWLKNSDSVSNRGDFF